jgi:plastocyanin
LAVAVAHATLISTRNSRSLLIKHGLHTTDSVINVPAMCLGLTIIRIKSAARFEGGAMSLFFILFIISFSPIQAADSGQKAFVGCLSQLPQGTFQLGVLPSGDVYSLAGNTEPLFGHVNQIVRVFGRAEPNRHINSNVISKLTVSSVQVLSETCTAGLPEAKTQTVVGKAGESQIAAPVTTTSMDETTPGFQTEGATIALSGAEGRRSAYSQKPATSPYSPLEPEQIAQSESAANLNAEAAARAEILPGKTLGANPASAGSAGMNSKHASSITPNSARVVVVEITGEGNAKISRQRVNIRVGDTVQWKNYSRQIHEIVANPAKATPNAAPTLPAGASPFDSGFLRPNQSFSYQFTSPGIYRYICDLNDSQPAIGEIEVAP